MLVFKEWAYIVEALASGRQSIILRKGGISEDEGDFTLRGEEFLLMPTVFHQSVELVKIDWYESIKTSVYLPDNLNVTINYKAHVVNHLIIETEADLLALDNLHVWKESVVLERFNRWKQNSVHCLFVEVSKLEIPLILDMKPEYGGCKSWLEI